MPVLDIQLQINCQLLSYQGEGNCSIKDTINTLGGGPAVIETLTTIEGNCGGVIPYQCQTLTTIMGNWGGVQFQDSKTLTHMVAKCGGMWSRELKTVTHMVAKCRNGWSRESKKRVKNSYLRQSSPPFLVHIIF